MEHRTYEVMFIVRPDLGDEEVDKLISGLENTITTGGGELKSVEKMGRRRLAYAVQKFQDGNYILFHVAADVALVAELERRLRVSEPVIKFLSVRMDEEEKKQLKMKALRDSRKKMSAEPAAVTPPPEPAEAAPAAEPEAATV